MNILEKIPFSSDKPAVLSVRKTEKINIIAIGLLEKQVLKKHKTSIPSLLVVLKGAILFRIKNETIVLKQFETYQIPIHIEHEAEGVDKKNCFMLTQEK